MLADDIKKQMFAAMKAKKTVEKEILKVALGELTARGEEVDDDACIAVLKKLVKSNLETLEAATDGEQQANLKEELVVLRAFLPASLSPENIAELLAPVAEAIKAASNDGQAIGTAMKHLKSTLDKDGPSFEGRDVKQAVASLRS